MKEIYTVSAYETSAEAFFTTLKKHHTDLVLDIRLHNVSQLCGFTKRKDLAYLVPTITGAKYVHDLRFAPDEELLSGYLHHTIDWTGYSQRYQQEMISSHAKQYFDETYGSYQHICLVGTATVKRRSHSEVLLNLLEGH